MKLTLEEQSDQDLLTAIRHGQPRAYEVLFNRYWKELYRKAYLRLKDDTYAEDMVQEVFMDVWERRETITVNGSLGAYLATALRNKTINWLARANLHSASMQHVAERMEQLQDSIFDELAVDELRATMEGAIAELPATTRRIFMLRSEDFSIREIATALGMAEQTVKNRSSEALHALKQALKRKHPDLHRSFFSALLLVLIA